jgi:hypothetical protein
MTPKTDMLCNSFGKSSTPHSALVSAACELRDSLLRLVLSPALLTACRGQPHFGRQLALLNPHAASDKRLVSHQTKSHHTAAV